MDPAPLFQQASDYAAGVFANVKADQHGDPTPCSEWNVAEEIAHVIGANAFFAAAARGEAPSENAPGDDLVAAYRDSVRDVMDAYSAEGVYEKMLTVPTGDMPGVQLYSIAMSEQLLHGWDIAKATGQDTTLEPGIAAAVDAMIRPNIDNAVAGGFYGPAVDVPDDASPGDKLVALVGRTP